METLKLKKTINDIPELKDWSQENINFLEKQVLEIKTKWREDLSEDDNWLTLGIALAWSDAAREGVDLPELNRTPSEYRELGRRHRSKLLSCAKSLANKAQAWGGFWDPENEKKEDSLGWKERKTSIAPHVWIGLKKRGFLQTINSPLDYEKASLKGLRNCVLYLLRKQELDPNLRTLLEAHKKLLGEISENCGEITTKQLCQGGYIACDPRLIPQEIEATAKAFRNGIKEAKASKRFKEAEIIRYVAFTAAKLLRIHAFESGNKRLIAAWALTFLSREIRIAKVSDIEFWKEMHKSFKELRKGNLNKLCRQLCLAFNVSNPEKDVPSFWLAPYSVAPKQITTETWENPNSEIAQRQLRNINNKKSIYKRKNQNELIASPY